MTPFTLSRCYHMVLAMLVCSTLMPGSRPAAQGISERVLSSTTNEFIKTIPATIIWIEGATRKVESTTQSGEVIEVEVSSELFTNLAAGLGGEGNTEVKVLAIDASSHIVTAVTPGGRKVKLAVPVESLANVNVGDTLNLVQ